MGLLSKISNRLNGKVALALAFIFSFGNCTAAFWLGHRWASLWIAPIWFAVQFGSWIAVSRFLKINSEAGGRTLLKANFLMGICFVVETIAYFISLIFPGLAMIALMILGMSGANRLLLLVWLFASAFSFLFIPYSSLKQAKVLYGKNSLLQSVTAVTPFILLVVIFTFINFRQILEFSGKENFYYSTVARITGNESSCYKSSTPWQCIETLAKSAKRPEICLKINLTGGPETCLERYAQAISKVEDCEKLNAFTSKAALERGASGTPLDRNRLKRASAVCYRNFIDSVQTQARCQTAWKNHDDQTAAQLKCYESKNSPQPIPGTLAAYMSKADLDEFLKLHPDLNAKDLKGRTVLHLLRSDSILRKLLKAGADPNIADNNRETAPMFWVDEGLMFMLSGANGNLDLLLQSHWNPNQTDKLGDTVLHKIAKSPKLISRPGHYFDFEQQLISDLIKKGANPKIKNKNHKTAKQIAMKRKLKSLFKER